MTIETSRPPAGAVWCVSACLVTALTMMAAAVGAPAHAQDGACASDSRPQVKVVVEGLRSDRGEVVVELYPNDPDRFLAHQGRLERVRQKAAKTGISTCINAPAAGLYAVVLYHDENNDEKFNRSKIGLPSEGFAFSNNVRPMLGPPSLKSVLFAVPEGGSTIRVRMRYLITDRG